MSLTRNKILLLRILLFGFMLSTKGVIAQKDIQKLKADSINQLKIDGKLSGQEQFTNSKARFAQVSPVTTNSAPPPLSCDCWIPRDASWQIAALDGSGLGTLPLAPDYRNDDWSTVELALPFNFCFYGTQVDSLFINNNGNVSVGASYFQFVTNSFPDTSFVMIAPFWADVDTRDPLSGLVYYSITPTRMIVQWENVGYYNTQSDKLNTFQLILTDGTDPILPAGQNTSFCYKDMQWTTGSASGGINGFGGTAATVGVNRGNGVDFIQVGRFDTIGSAYDGPYANNDGIDALDNQSFYFNSCVSSSNVAPLVTAIQVCDTHKVCINDTLVIHAEYLSPEQGQLTVASVNPNGMTGVSILSTTTGITASIDVQIIGLASNVGYHTIFITGTDNGTPPLTNSTPVIVQVMPAPITSFIYSPISPINPGTTINFTNTSIGAFTYLWDFGDGTPTSSVRDPSHTFNNAGTFNVTLTSTGPNGCSSTQTAQVIVASCSSANFTVIDTLCIGTPATVTFTGVATPGATFDWNFGSATILSGSGIGPYSVAWNTAGNQTISLTVNDAPCAAVSTSMPVYVVPMPVASLTSLSDLCVGDQNTLAFNGTAQSNATFVWNYGSGTVVGGMGTLSNPYTMLWNTSGSTSVNLIVNQNGCTDTTQLNFQVFSIPTSTFSLAPSVCAGSTVQINYTGSAAASATFTWDFGGGTVHSGSGIGPYTISWPNAGNPSVTLTVLDNACPSAVSSNSILVNAIPTASINTNQFTCPDEANTVTFTGTPASGGIYTWNFGSATVLSGSGSGPYVLTWSNSGIDSIGLIINQNGCTDTTTFTVTIYQPPTSTFTLPPTACPGDSLQIIYTGIANPAALYTWNFDNGIIISGNGVGPYTVAWFVAGSANVTLLVTENGCQSPLTQNNIVISTLPSVDAGSDVTVCSGTTLSIGSSSSPGITYSWWPSTGLTSPNSSMSSLQGVNSGVYSEVRKYVLEAVSAIGCVNTDTVIVTINPIPVVAFTNQAAQCLEDNKFQFYLSGTRIPGANYTWTFGPQGIPSQSTSEIPSLVHFVQTGRYPVTLEASFGDCIATPFTDTVLVVADPTAAFSPLILEGCVPLTVPFSNQSTGNDNTYLWTFSDNSTDTITSSVHVFTTPGTYSVELLAQSAEGCTDYISYSDLITVFPLPQSAFIPSPERTNILEPMIQFINSTPGINQYYWEFGDGDSSILTNPDHLYKEIGTYTVTLFVSNIYGCRDSITALVSIEDDLTFYIPNAFSPNGDGRNDTFSGFGTRLKSYHMDILDRWGLVIYSTDNINEPWDGKIKNSAQADVYLYKILVTDFQDKSHQYTGHVSVIR